MPTEKEFEERRKNLIESLTRALSNLEYGNVIGCVCVYLSYDGIAYLESYGIPGNMIKGMLDCGQQLADGEMSKIETQEELN